MLVEGPTDEALAVRLIEASGHQPGPCYGKQGIGYLKKKLAGFNNTAHFIPYLALIDFMDTDLSCPAEVISTWLPDRKHLMLARVVVRELESWLLADRENLARFLGVRPELIPENPENLPDPKEMLVKLALKSRKRTIKHTIAPEQGSTSRVGKLYTSSIIEFINRSWDFQTARQFTPSLDRCLRRLESIS